MNKAPKFKMQFLIFKSPFWLINFMMVIMKMLTYIGLIMVSTTVIAADQFTKVNPNKGYQSIISQSKDSSFLKNSDYFSAFIKNTTRLKSNNFVTTTSRDNVKNVAANSVIIDEGATITGDVIVNIEITGDTYVNNR